MKKEPSVILIIMLWSLIIILNIWTIKTQISFKLDKIEKNQKEIIEYFNKGDVGE
jgi:hypothetical protein